MLFERNLSREENGFNTQRQTFVVMKATQDMGRMVRNTMKRIQTKKFGKSSNNVLEVQYEASEPTENTSRYEVTDRSEGIKTLKVNTEEAKITLDHVSLAN